MPTNHYFNFHENKPEQWLNEDLVIEAIKMFGMDMVYIPRTLVREDKLFGEDIMSAFTDPYYIEMYVESVDGFEGSGDMLSRFGLEIRDSAKLILSKKRFKFATGLKRPNEGDLIYFPLSKGLFEIKFVEHESPFYQLGKNHVFKLSVELFQMGNETINTGISAIDDPVDDLVYSVIISMTSVTGAFAVGQTAYLPITESSLTGDGYITGATARGEIHYISPGLTSMHVKNVWGNWAATGATLNNVMYVANSAYDAYATITAISDSYDEETTNIDYASNKAIEDEADEWLDFDENNPFGDP